MVQLAHKEHPFSAFKNRQFHFIGYMAAHGEVSPLYCDGLSEVKRPWLQKLNILGVLCIPNDVGVIHDYPLFAELVGDSDFLVKTSFCRSNILVKPGPMWFLSQLSEASIPFTLAQFPHGFPPPILEDNTFSYGQQLSVITDEPSSMIELPLSAGPTVTTLTRYPSPRFVSNIKTTAPQLTEMVDMLPDSALSSAQGLNFSGLGTTCPQDEQQPSNMAALTRSTSLTDITQESDILLRPCTKGRTDSKGLGFSSCTVPLIQVCALNFRMTSGESPRKSEELPDERGKVRKDFPDECKQLPNECGKVPEELPEITMGFHPDTEMCNGYSGLVLSRSK
ncbi:uncharacterized protein HD556DRAFT_1440281 [Suillus plorans]|uniref:Uncharacterized protein n=1 Tax=Suillus plorans TaxID=116603 RepID=A0A9P7J0M1_9AGAM|nr:uncharacterized protein HD556DRAFT_1440281 [Suillus plorans]KAG1798574.1 hypothetical protein HD556DRAFT_1440281 [Suillus plorans]